MFVIQFTSFSQVAFYDLWKTDFKGIGRKSFGSKKEWYFSDYPPGGKIEAADIICSNGKQVFCYGIDGQVFSVNLDSVMIYS